MKPGLVCYECQRYFHGKCMEPPRQIKALGEFVIKTSKWYCSTCSSQRTDNESGERTKEDRERIKNKVAMILELRDILIMTEEALRQMMEANEEIRERNAELKKANQQMKARLALHKAHGHTAPKNVREWRDQRKKLGITDRKDIGPSKKGPKRKKKNENREKLKKLKKKHHVKTKKSKMKKHAKLSWKQSKHFI